MIQCKSEEESREGVIQQTHQERELRSEAVYTPSANKQRLSSLTRLTGLFETDIRALFSESLDTIATNSLHGHTHPQEWQKTAAPASMGECLYSDLALLLQQWELFFCFYIFISQHQGNSCEPDARAVNHKICSHHCHAGSFQLGL